MDAFKKFYRQHKRGVLATLGVLMVAAGLISLYWSQPSAQDIKNENARKNIERMKSKGMMGGSKNSKKSSGMNMMSNYMDKKAEQNRILIVILIIGGVLSMTISFFSKEKEPATH